MPKTDSIALRYTGPAIVPGEGVPLPQGWPAEDHSEPDAKLRAEKIASGFYALAGGEPSSDSPVTGGEVPKSLTL